MSTYHPPIDFKKINDFPQSKFLFYFFSNRPQRKQENDGKRRHLLGNTAKQAKFDISKRYRLFFTRTQRNCNSYTREWNENKLLLLHQIVNTKKKLCF